MSRNECDVHNWGNAFSAGYCTHKMMINIAVHLLASALLCLAVVKGHTPNDQNEQYLPLGRNYNYIFTVDPTDAMAVDSEMCYPPKGGGNSTVPCKTLDYAFQQLNSFNLESVKFYLASSNSMYELNFSFNVTSKCNVGFYGSDAQYPLVPMVKCGDNSGLSFTDSCNIVLHSIQFVECGALHASTSKSSSKGHEMTFLSIRVGLYFYNCTNVEMYHLGVLNGPQAIGVVMYDTNGLVKATNCVFANNTVSRDGSHAGGGGFTVEFTYCKPGSETCNHNETEYDSSFKRNRNSVYMFSNCTFEENVANKLSSDSYFVMPTKSHHDATSRGGGLSVFFKGDAMNNSVSIVDSCFTRNHAIWGGGLHIEMSDNTINNTVSVSDSNFTGNDVLLYKGGKYTAGGGIHVVIATHFLDRVTEDVSKSKINVTGCSLYNNQASEGGGIAFAIARQDKLNIDQVLEILISKSLFEYNQARLGAAVVLLYSPIFIDGFLPVIQFHDCKFLSNKLMIVSDLVHGAGLAAVYVSEIQAIFQNNAVFSNNTGSALVVVGSQVNFVGTTALFENNIGSNGGAIALLGVSSIFIGTDTHMTFVNNTAKHYGGAIYNRYIGNEDVQSTAECFLRYSEPFIDPANWKVYFNFSDNTAVQDGCSIASTSLLPCSWSEDIQRVFHWNEQWHYENQNCEKRDILTGPIHFTLKNHSIYETPPVEFTPGGAFILPLEAWDELNNNVTNNTVYTVSVLNGDSLAEVDPGYTYVASNYISLSGKPQSNITILMETVESRTIHVEVNMKILKCPPGFILVQSGDNNSSETTGESRFLKKSKCECPTDDQKYRHLLKCYYTSFMVKIDIDYWYGPVNTTLAESNDTVLTNLMGMAVIPYRFVSEGRDLTLNGSMDDAEWLLCGRTHRRGVLCGECIEGYAVAVNSPTYECVPCNHTTSEFVGNLFAYAALTYVPIMVVFIVIILFKIKLASSAAAGFVLYAQVINSGCFVTGYSWLYVVTNKEPITTVQKVYTFFYSIFNLNSYANYLTPFCLNKSFTTLHVLCLDYAIAIFPLVVILVIYLAYRCNSVKCKCPVIAKQQETAAISSDGTSVQSISSAWKSRKKNRPNNTLIHALMAFMLLSYTKFSLASIRTVVLDELFDSSGNTVTHRVYLAGHLSFSDPQYLFPFGILAILVLAFIVFLPPVLLLGPLQFIDWLIDKHRFSWLSRYWPSITIHTFLDTLQGYKPNRRFFGGLYLLFRLFMFLAFSFSLDLITQYTIQQIIVLIFIVLVSLLKPYTNPFFNYLDTLLFLNLGVLNAMAIYSAEHNYSATIYGFTCFLMFLPLIYMLCYVIWNKCHKRKHYKLIKDNINIHLVNPVKASCMGNNTHKGERRRLLSYGESVNYYSDDADDEIFQRAERVNNFRAANIHTIPPRRPGEVPRSVVTIQDPQLARIEEEEKETDTKKTSDSGIGRQSGTYTCSGVSEMDNMELDH